MLWATGLPSSAPCSREMPAWTSATVSAAEAGPHPGRAHLPLGWGSEPGDALAASHRPVTRALLGRILPALLPEPAGFYPTRQELLLLGRAWLQPWARVQTPQRPRALGSSTCQDWRFPTHAP